MDERNPLKYFEEQKDYMNRRVNYGIEEYRKADAMLSFVDKEGKPVNDIKFHAKLVNHKFDFGCNIFLLDEFENEEKNSIYRKSLRLLRIVFHKSSQRHYKSKEQALTARLEPVFFICNPHIGFM